MILALTKTKTGIKFYINNNNNNDDDDNNNNNNNCCECDLSAHACVCSWVG